MASTPYPAACLASSSSLMAIASGSSIHLRRLSSAPSSSKPTPDPKIHSTSLIRHVAISPDEQYLAALTDSKHLLVYSTSSLDQLSSRQLSKRGARLSFSPAGDVIVTDKVGDVYLYPLEPRSISEAHRPSTGILTADPSRNIDADLLLGHVSLISTHLLTPDGKWIITADRDEHIRISRFPQSYIIERYLFGSESFVSALQIPRTKPEWLISGGGETSLRIWDWQKGRQLGTVDIADVLKYRRVRSTLRKIKRQAGKRTRVESSDPFYDVEEGWMLPSGRGVCIKKIDSVRIGECEVVLFYSQGCAALHSFVLPSDLSQQTNVHTLPTSSPILDFTIPSLDPERVLVSLDTAWGKLRENPSPSNMRGVVKDPTLSSEDLGAMKRPLLSVEVSPSGELSDVSTASSALLDPLHSLINEPSLLASPSEIAMIDHYSELSLFPRWPGFEEDDDLAGPAEGGTPGPEYGKTYTQEELEKMAPKELGRLKSKGVDVGDIITKKRKMQKGKAGKRLDAPTESGQD